MIEPIRLGSRRSALARVQAEAVADALRRRRTPVEIVAVKSDGDRERRSGRALDFTGIFERMLDRGEIDAAVHSAKDLPARTDERFAIAAYPPRADPRDVLIARRGLLPGRLPRGARIGTSSARRHAQLSRWRPDLTVLPMRGNVDTRLGRLERYDGIVLAAAGLDRLRRREPRAWRLPLDRFLPAPGQGALAIEIRREDRHARRAIAPIDSARTRACVTAERAVARSLGGDCSVPLATYGQVVRSRRLALSAELLSPQGDVTLRASREGPLGTADRLGRELGLTLRRNGADRLLKATRR